MSELNEIQSQFKDIRQQIAVSHTVVQKEIAILEKLKEKESQELRSLNNKEREIKKAEYENLINQQKDKITRLRTAKSNQIADLQNLSVEFQALLNPIKTIGLLNDSFPILLFPLRLETRFKTVDNQPQLWLRVYPDDCNINHKEEILSDSELTNATSFWTEMWKAGGIEEEERGAWRTLVNSHGSGRAEWIINQFKPLNTKPVKTNSTYKILVFISDTILTSNELTAARDYWVAVWMADGVKSTIDTAFNNLNAAVGNAKATEIIENCEPKNIRDSVPKDLNNDQVLFARLELPNPDDIVTTSVSWTQAPKTIGLPDRFVAIAFTGDTQRTIIFDKPVKDSLIVGPDPSLPEDEQLKKDENGDLIINEDLQWMVDFDMAIETGMGVKINLSVSEAQEGFDKLYVTGIRLTSDETDGKEVLEKLITDHFQGKDGFGLLKQGTPTNNTEEESAGYSWIDNSDESYDRIFKNTEDYIETTDLEETSDGQKLADSLGIDSSVLKKVPNANGRDQIEANAINKALFPATLGYFMREMMTPLFSEADIDNTRTFFSGYVSGRGPIPAIRIGKQPYGILPVSVYSRMNFISRLEAGTSVPSASKLPYLARLYNLIMKMDASWDSFIPDLAYVGKEGGDPHQILLDILGLHANSIEFHQRYAQSIQSLYDNLKLQFGSQFANIISTFFRNRGKSILTGLGIDLGDTILPIMEKYFLSKPNLLSGPLVDDVPASETNAIRAYDTLGNNYIEWMIVSEAEKIRLQDFGGNTPPNALLYLLLRLALMQAMSDSGSNVLINNQVIQNKNIYYDPDYIHVQSDYPGKSKFEHLYSTYPNITGSDTVKLVDYLLQPAVLQLAELKNLKDTLDALKVIQKSSTASLERLLAEHLDCCNYRIDAWKTGLVNAKLTQQRQINTDKSPRSKGLYLGAYGWLLDVKPEEKTLTNVTLTPKLNDILNKGQSTPLQTDSTNLGYVHAPSLNQAATAAILRNAYDSNKEAGSGNPFAINLTSNRVRIANNFLEGIRNGQSLSALLGYQFERGLHDKYSLGQGEVDMFIYPLRKAFPLVADNLKDTKSENTDSIDTIQANNVIDGLKLIQYVQNSSVKTYPFGLPSTYNLPAANANQAKAINDEVARITDIHDAIGDLVLSEQVYQVVQGNFERSAGNAEAFSKGNYPPDIDIMSTPRSGVTLTQRMAIHFNADASSIVSPNGSISPTPRMKIEPGVNEWLYSILPLPSNVVCKVNYTNPVASGEEKVTQEMLGLQPIDLLYTFNLDTEQAMTELDDRIANYVRYQISNHPKTEVSIKYTEPIDSSDKTKISFFELAALIKSLRKILIGAKYISPTEVTIQTDGQSVAAPDAQQLGTRISAILTSDFDSAQSGIINLQSSIVSAIALSDTLKSSLSADITDSTTLESLILQFRSDLKEYASDPTNANKTALVDAYGNSIVSIGDVSKISNYKTAYESMLNSYTADFATLDHLIDTASGAILNMALFESNQTGVGFMQQAINNMYDSVFNKLNVVIDRWERKNTDYIALMGEYDPSGDVDVQTELLRKAERIIRAEGTFPSPALSTYKSNLDGYKSDFDTLLNKLKSLKTNNKPTTMQFITDCDNIIKDIGTYDVLAFDKENNRNDLKTEKQSLLLLKEDIAQLLENIRSFAHDKYDETQTAIGEATATIVISDKINAYLAAAKKLFGEEVLVLPRFKMDETQAMEFDNSYQTSENLLDFVKTLESRPFPTDDWLGGVARIRDKVHHWENTAFLASSIKPGVSLDITPMQFPFLDDDRWLAMKFRDESNDNTVNEDTFSINTDKLLYTAHFAGSFDKTKYQCGIIVDEWTEVIPLKEETTGIAFHYDQPNSEPPQTILLVVPPDITGNWKWDDLIDSLTETLQMTKKRAIEPAQIEKSDYAQFLPTTMMAVTLYWITIATNLAINNNVYLNFDNN